METGEGTNFTTGKLAKMFGVSTQSIRNWVDRGLLSPPIFKTPGGQARFGQKHVTELRRITSGTPVPPAQAPIPAEQLTTEPATIAQVVVASDPVVPVTTDTTPPPPTQANSEAVNANISSQS